MISATDQKRAAQNFVEFWKKAKGSEISESQDFWRDLFLKIFGIADTKNFLNFEKKVRIDKKMRRIDVYVPQTRVLIEQKSRGVDLDDADQTTGLTPFQQALRYRAALPDGACAHIITCNFDKFRIYDMTLANPTEQKPKELRLKDLPNQLGMLAFLVDQTAHAIDPQKTVSTQAAELIRDLYTAFLPKDEKGKVQKCNDDFLLKNLNKLCVRLVFCLYAENAGIFANKQFGQYLRGFHAGNIGIALRELFRVLNLKNKAPERALLDERLKKFPFVNGGLFDSAENDPIPPFNEETFEILVSNCSEKFDWSEISPTIFGAMFESTLNPDTRTEGGMHYTSVENIKKVIDPLFLNDLKRELRGILKERASQVTKKQKLYEFQKKLGSLKFLDPACGSGNFLTQTYIELRDLENEILEFFAGGNRYLDGDLSPVQVKLEQFYGIEINDFAVSVARTAMWIAESQKLMASQRILGASKKLEFLPLSSFSHIQHANALRVPWDFVEKNETGYIISNPPFVGYSTQNERQKAEMREIFANSKSAGKIDYVAAWFLKAADFMTQNPKIKTAFVATNSICQGDQVSFIWKPILEKDFHIDFGYRTFQWDSAIKAQIKAHVHVVIVGFSKIHGKPKIFLENGEAIAAKNISPYLIDSPTIFVESHGKPFCKVPEMITGNRPADGGNLIIEENEIDEFLKDEPHAKKFIKRFVGAEEFINNKKRYCLWLVGADPAELRKMPRVLARIKDCKEDRLKGAADRQKLAQTPALMREQINPKNYLLFPCVSSETRFYMPIGFLNDEFIASDACTLIPNASLFEFGILTSSVHMAWMKAVCGRLESRYRYSIRIVYNNFIWPDATEKEKAKIAELAQKILNARALFPNASLADLYDPNTMPPELLKAHKALDSAVLKLYKLKPSAPESEIVSHLMKLYAEKTGQKWD